MDLCRRPSTDSNDYGLSQIIIFTDLEDKKQDTMIWRGKVMDGYLHDIVSHSVLGGMKKKPWKFNK